MLIHLKIEFRSLWMTPQANILIKLRLKIHCMFVAHDSMQHLFEQNTIHSRKRTLHQGSCVFHSARRLLTVTMPDKQNKSVVILDLSVLPRRPGPLVIERFITRSLNLRLLEDLLSVQYKVSSSFVYLKCANSEVANKLAEKNLKCTIKCEKEEFLIPIFVDDDLIEIRILDLPFEIADEAILKCIRQYGNVQTISSERWKKFFGGMPNGVRLIRMKLELPIPKRLNIDGNPCISSYKGQPTRLNKCNTSSKTPAKNKTKKKTSNSNKPNQASSDKTESNTNSVPSSSRNNDNSNNNKPNTDNGNNNADNMNRINNNSHNEANQPKEIDNSNKEDNEGFQVVLSKLERKNRKRGSVEHNQEDVPNPKRLEKAESILEAVSKKKRHYYEKWLSTEVVKDCDLKKIHEYYEKYEKYEKMEQNMIKSAKQKSEQESEANDM